VLVDREVLAIAPKAQSKVAMLPLRPAKYSPCQLRVQVGIRIRMGVGIGVCVYVYVWVLV
jgi:hypothetical protein